MKFHVFESRVRLQKGQIYIWRVKKIFLYAQMLCMLYCWFSRSFWELHISIYETTIKPLCYKRWYMFNIRIFILYSIYSSTLSILCNWLHKSYYRYSMVINHSSEPCVDKVKDVTNGLLVLNVTIWLYKNNYSICNCFTVSRI